MRAYVINLDRSADRLAAFSREAGRIGLAFERIGAIDGRAMTPAELVAAISPDHHFQPINAGEAAVFLSHRECWRKLVDSGEKMAAILEDDAVLASDMVAVLEAIDRLDPTFGICRLETTGRRIVVERNGTDIRPGFRLHRQLTWHGGAAGYVMTRKTAQFLLERTARVADPVDHAIFHPRSPLFSHLSVYQCVPACVIQYGILHAGEEIGALGSTTGRKTGGRSLLRHGLVADLRRAWIRHAERRLRNRLAKAPENISLSVPFAGS